ncbi:uncharacterized protein SCHCODRAFT_02509143 [Schizophyllum commune H4-8]|uniref:MIF4G domain-containing protein n=1 Tax=Schizophyllum commune (strain H4-8 / FGSC 9210) TaxID=578458 RepID=D8Q9Y2_SCHCM|nr:uncharacterized protein SCHCODRAFT_02509143 [Schizophyllum commune H4-8]KAI5890229.1 hypothetical protein SCHCODRAFT_02509143 [Schizophyllum commune H4-8]
MVAVLIPPYRREVRTGPSWFSFSETTAPARQCDVLGLSSYLKTQLLRSPRTSLARNMGVTVSRLTETLISSTTASAPTSNLKEVFGEASCEMPSAKSGEAMGRSKGIELAHLRTESREVHVDHQPCIPDHCTSPAPRACPIQDGIFSGPHRYDRKFLLQFKDTCRDKPDFLVDLKTLGLEPSGPIRVCLAVANPGHTTKNQRRRARRERRAMEMAQLGLATLPRPALDSKARTAPTGLLIELDFDHDAIDAPKAWDFMASLVKAACFDEETWTQLAIRSSNADKMLSLLSSVSASQPISHCFSQDEIALSLPDPDGSGVWALTICPTRSSDSTSSLPWTFRLHDPQGTAHDLVAGRRDSSVLLHRALNPWRPFSLRRRYGSDGDHDAVDDEDEWREVVRRKVTALLNKLTAGNLDTISKQIIKWANESESEEDARTVKLVVQLVLDAARDMPLLSGMYAHLCCRIASRCVGSRVKGGRPVDVARTPQSGGALFSDLLFDHIKKEFGIVPFSVEQRQTTVEGLASKAAAAHDGINGRHGTGVSSRRPKAARRGYGLAVFVATLVKLGEYSKDVLLMFVQELLDTIVSHKDSQDIECLCTLLSIAGDRLETQSRNKSLDLHFTRMKKLSKSRRVKPRERFMLEDVIERRKGGWNFSLPLTPRSDRATVANCSDEGHAEGHLPEPSHSYQFARRHQSRDVLENPVLSDSVPLVPARASGMPLTQAHDADEVKPFLSSFTFRPYSTSKRHNSPSQPQTNATASPRKPPAQSLPGGPAPSIQPGMPPAPMQGWFYPPPYGGYVDPNWAAAYGQWYMPQQGPPPMSPQQHPAQPPPMPMSPRNAPPPLQGGPGTPAPVHASPVPHPPPSHAPSNSINGVASPPGTPASATVPVPGGRLNQSAAPFTPSSSARKITLRAPDGSELKFDKFKQNGQQPAASPATPTVTSPRKPVKIEKPTEAHEKRIAAEKAEAEAKAKKERKQKVRDEKELRERKEILEEEEEEEEEEELQTIQEAERKSAGKARKKAEAKLTLDGFMEVCKEKPLSMSSSNASGIERMGPADFAMFRGRSHRKSFNA